MITDEKQMRKLMRLDAVPRWVVVRTNQQQNVATHSFKVSVIARYILRFHTQGTDLGFKLSVIEGALDHDVDEAITGDPPSTTKGVKDYSGWRQSNLLVKMADLMEASVFCMDEELLGNALVSDIKKDISKEIARVSSYIHWVPSIEGLDVAMRFMDDLYKHPNPSMEK